MFFTFNPCLAQRKTRDVSDHKLGLWIFISNRPPPSALAQPVARAQNICIPFIFGVNKNYLRQMAHSTLKIRY